MNDATTWRYWEIQFDKDGHSDAALEADLIDRITSAGLKDLIIMTHGWQNDLQTAQPLYAKWFGMLPTLLSTTSVGTLGVMWPSMLWPDEAPPAPVPTTDGGAAALSTSSGQRRPGAPVAALAAVYPDAKQREILQRLAALLDDQPPGLDKLTEFHALMGQLAATEPQTMAIEDAGTGQILTEDPYVLATRFARQVDLANATWAGIDQGPATSIGATNQGGFDSAASGVADSPAASIGGEITSWLWNGAKEALRQLTFWQMKGRAGTIGQKGLGPFLGNLHGRAPDLRVHLVGHSFGARLNCFSLAGLPDAAASPVASITLIEGAFSHFAFAPVLPQDRSRAGALYGMLARVSGPALACFSSHDLALGIFYPAGAMTVGDDAADLVDDVLSRWGAIGHDGAQAVGAASTDLVAPGTPYSFVAGQFTNIDSSAIVCHGGPPSGAHGDIFHPELGWVMLAAAGLV